VAGQLKRAGSAAAAVGGAAEASGPGAGAVELEAAGAAAAPWVAVAPEGVWPAALVAGAPPDVCLPGAEAAVSPRA